MQNAVTIGEAPEGQLAEAARRGGAICEPRVLLHGYYGGGNLGDDILLKVAYSVVREVVPADGIAIAAASGRYIERLLGEASTVITPGETCPATAVWIAGGGGLHFGFKGGNWVAAGAQWLLHVVGAARLLRLEQMLAPRRRPLYSAALGIGVGPFRRGTWNEVRSALTLAEYGWIAVRDEESMAQCRAWGLPGLLVEGTDGAFMRSRWGAGGVARRRAGGPERVSIVIRDWRNSTPSNEYLRPLMKAASELRAAGVAVRYLSFDPDHDTGVMGELGGEEVRSWEPEDGFEPFLAEIADSDLVISARAHGAILAACLGVPSISIGVEPKLRAVSRMLRPMGRLWGHPFEAGELGGMAESILAGHRAEVEGLGEVVQREQKKAESCAELLKASIQDVLNKL